MIPTVGHLAGKIAMAQVDATVLPYAEVNPSTAPGVNALFAALEPSHKREYTI